MQKENVENLKRILTIIRKTTKAIKLFPFLYIGLFIVLSFAMGFASIEATRIISGIIIVSPIMVAFLIYLSYAVKLCFWHRLQCALPLIPQALVIIDTHIYEYGEALAILNYAILLLLFSLSLVNAYFVFIRPSKRKL